ncbi:MAG TPA: IS3 family transposase [Pseudonocardiaceae bacterium]|nr:IS3 family transposase [Pseudonocardiaceae bacterium]
MAEFIAAQRADYGVPHALACRALGVSQAWFYKWRHGDASPRRARRRALTSLITALFARHRGTYGAPRITADLRAAGWRVSPHTVAAIMAEQGLKARAKRRRHNTTRPGKGRWHAPDRVNRKFSARRLNQRWFGDGTEINTAEGKLQLASVLDVRSRRILGFALSEHHDADLAYGSLAMAVAVRGGHMDGVVLHTDRGSEYTAGIFRAACVRLGITQSMGRPGSALDNSIIESWHSTLEFELRSLEEFPTKAAARTRVAAWIDEYNRTRRHSSLGMISPIDYELAHPDDPDTSDPDPGDLESEVA